MKRILGFIGIAVGVLLLIVLALVFFVDANQFRPKLESSLSQALGRPVTVGNLKVSLLSGGVAADDLTIADDPSFSKSPFVHAQSLTVGVEMWPLIVSRKLNVTALTIDQPEVSLLQTPSGEWNFSSLGSKSKMPPPETKPPGESSFDLSAKLVKITGGHFSLGEVRAKSKPLVLDNVNLEVRDFSAASAFPFSFSAKVAGGGDVKLDGKAGPIDAADAALTAVDAALNVSGLDLVASGVVKPSAGIAGLVSFDGKGASNGQTVNVEGRIRAERFKLVKSGSPASRPVQFDFAVVHDLRKRSGALRRGNLHFGSAPASLTGTYDLRPETAVVNLLFSGAQMAVPELASMLPALDIVLPAGSSLQGGTARAKLNIEGPIDALVISGPVGLSNTRLAGFNMGAKMAAVETLAGIPGGPNTDIENFGAAIRIAPQGMSIQDVELVIPSIGNLTGGGTISASHALDFKMRALVHTSGPILAALGQKGDTGVPFLIGGTSSDPVFRPDVKAIASQKINQEVQSLTGNSAIGKAAGGLLNNLFGGKKKN